MAIKANTAKQGRAGFGPASSGRVVDADRVALSVTDSMISVDHELSHVPAKTALELIEFCRRRLEATESRLSLIHI